MAKILVDWKNHLVFERNKQPGHVPLKPYNAQGQALKGQPSPYVQLLNGDWKFSYAPNPEAAPQDFFG